MTQLVSLFDIQPLLEPLGKGELILTANQRLASRVVAAFAIHCRADGNMVIPNPRVYSINQWVDHCWQRLLAGAEPVALSYQVLSLSHEQVLWEHIVSQSDVGAALLRPTATAMQASAAYRQLVDWQLDLSNSSLRECFSGDEDSAVLLGWVEQFEQYCSDRQWLPSARLTEQVKCAFEEGLLERAGPIWGVGFEDIPPLQQALLTSAGQFQMLANQRRAGEVTVVECDSPKQELMAAAVWAKQILKHDPSATVAVVIPNLAQQRAITQRVFQEVFSPDYNVPLTAQMQVAERKNLPFNFSAGYPLLEAPVIDAAVNVLALSQQTLELDTLINICQSPFYCLDNDDSGAVSLLISLLHDESAEEISTARFRQLADKVSDLRGESEQQWTFAAALQSLADLSRRSLPNAAQPMAYWVDIFTTMLTTMQWPGRRTLDSIEYQQVSHWQQALKQSATLDLVLAPISFTAALAQLRGYLSRHIFQPQTADSSLQILGTLEASGLQFSHLWLQSMSEQQWPPAPSPNPLLPYSLQREHNMPHATAERELLYAEQLSRNFIHSANHVIISSPSVIDDNPATVSCLFKDFPKKNLDELLGRSLQSLLPLTEIRRRHRESKQIETFEPGAAPILTVEETIRGGTALFSSQSACPFKAFASHRLGLKPLAEVEIGLSPSDRGSLLHRALELLWKKLKTQQALLALSHDQQLTLCADVCHYALDEISQRRSAKLGPRFKALESLRLQRLLTAWLEVEKSRASFTVEHIESRQAFQFAQLQLETRIDRIDRMDDGSLIIIDYKTGKPSINYWWGDRPEEPQLPLYSMLAENQGDKVGGIAFAQVRIDSCELKGIGSEDLSEPLVKWKDKIKSDAGVLDWAQLKQNWIRVLTDIANDFIAGKADVDPKNPNKICQYCRLSSVCRVNHQQVMAV
ncbi:MAG: PD-(D/E)XK nuclease family protein [Spongiibacteraceae bacterium]